MDDPTDGMDALTRVRSLIVDLLAAHPELGSSFASLLKLLEPIEKDLRQYGSSAERSGRRVPRGSRKIHYTIESSVDNPMLEVLTERRPEGDARPLRCSRPIFRALSKAFASATKPLDFQELLLQISRVEGTKAPIDNQVRVGLRFLMSQKPALVVRTRAKYGARSPKALVKDADQAWLNLRKHPMPPAAP